MVFHALYPGIYNSVYERGWDSTATTAGQDGSPSSRESTRS